MLSCSAGLRQEPVFLKVWRTLGSMDFLSEFWNDFTVHHCLESLHQITATAKN